MAKNTDRDEAMDHLLKNAFRSGAFSGDRDVCPGAEVLAAWTEGNLSPREAAKVEAHLAACATCQEVLAVFARTHPPPAAPASRWRRWRLQWAVPIAAAATVFAIYVAAPGDRQPPLVQTRSATTPEPPASEPAPRATLPAAPPAEERDTLARQDAVSPQIRQEKAARAPEPLLRAESAQGQQPSAAAAPATDQAFADSSERRAAASAVAPTEVVSPDPLVRWRIVAAGQLERSTNAGKTWESVTLPPSVSAAAVSAPSPTAAIVTASDGRRFRSDDQGKTWTEFTD